jgi:hypothetical protein
VAIDYISPTGQVRLLIADVDETNPLISDAQIAGYLALNDDSVRLAAADALEAIAASEVLVSKKIRTQDLATDGPAVAAELRALAKRLRDQVADDAEADIFDVVDTLPPSCRPELTEWQRTHTVWGL